MGGTLETGEYLAGLGIWLEINLYKILLHVFQTVAKHRIEMCQGI